VKNKLLLILLFALAANGSKSIGQDTSNCFMNDFAPVDAVVPPYADYERTTAIPTVNISIDYTDTISRVSRYIFGNAVAVWVSPDVNNPTVIGQLQLLSPTLIRFPGGSWSDVYFWNGNPGDLPVNVPNGEGVMISLSPQYGPQHTPTFNSYLDMRSQIGTQGLITINYAYARYGLSEKPAEQAAHLAADWVRADNGHTQFWEIGNENAGSWEAGYRINTSVNQDGQPEIITGELYAQHFKIFADSMRKAASEVGAEIYIGAQLIQFDASGGGNPNRDWNASVYSVAGEAVDFYVIHNYFGGSTSSPGSYLNTALTSIDDMHSFLTQDITNRSAPVRPISLTEWNMSDDQGRVKTSFINGMQGVLAMSEMAKLGYGMSCRWLIANWGVDGMFYHGSDASIPAWNPRPAFFYLYYLQKYIGSYFLGSEVTGSDNIKAYTTLFGSGEVGVVLVNKGTTDEAVQIDLSNTGYGSRYYYYTLTGGTDDPPYSKMVYVNDSGPEPTRWGPLANLTSLKARSDTLLYPIKLNSPHYSVQYILIESGDSMMHQVNVDSVTISPAGEVLTITEDNGTIPLVAQIYPWNATNNGVTWSTSDSAVAFVNPFGVIKAIYNGSAYIKTTTVDGDYTDSIEVDVSNQRYEVTGITVTTESGSRFISTPGGSLQMVANIEPENAENKAVTWSVDSTSRASIDENGLLIAKKNGRVVVTGTAVDGGLSDDLSITISGQPSALIDQTLSYLKVYPNPAQDVIYIENNSRVLSYEIISIEGNLIKTINNPDKIIEVDISDLARGIYLIRAHSKTNSVVVRFVK
jgi:hypothetical protein